MGMTYSHLKNKAEYILPWVQVDWEQRLCQR